MSIPAKPIVMHSLTSSPCCNAPRQLVRSRKNNFVTQNCIQCAKTPENAKTVSLDELPDIRCMNCCKTVAASYVGLYRDYGYTCPCGWVVVLGALLPYWEDAGFEYSGVAAPGDF